MRQSLTCLLVLFAVSLQAKTLQEVRDAANAVLVPWYTDSVVPAQEAYFDTHGKYFQCVMSANIPNTTTADAVVAEIVGDRYAEVIHDQAHSCLDILPALSTSKPYLFWSDTLYDRLHGHAVVSCIVVRHDGLGYKRCQQLHRPDSGAQATCSPTCPGFPELQHGWQRFPGADAP